MWGIEGKKRDIMRIISLIAQSRGSKLDLSVCFLDFGVRYDTVQYSAVQCSAVQCSAVRLSISALWKCAYTGHLSSMIRFLSVQACGRAYTDRLGSPVSPNVRLLAHMYIFFLFRLAVNKKCKPDIIVIRYRAVVLL